ncbi:hypothetical protein [Dyadobacter sp. NIV53]|uniref:hypothetical protein n=1 Tax=Dyadobacter sp. NIV53 TaxID=2861765 RepID=UPI001C879C59|nr:hypothetical protein [Dyadobacter sp. NIV53]
MPELIPPIDIPWKLIDVSQDMIDPGFCDNAAPTCFKSSIAVFAYEPSQSEIPIEMCGEKLTYLKVTISLTGYQLQTDDWSRLEGIVSTFSSGELRTILGDYLACYGAMVHISTFPPQDTITDLTLFPHIVDFEPKLRELLQVTSETGEVLTGSQSSISVDKSFSRTHGNEVGLEHSGKYKSPESNAGSFEASHTIKGTWKDSTTESFQVNADASRERSERQSTRTDLNQMYNLLTGYHSGTNRALF